MSSSSSCSSSSSSSSCRLPPEVLGPLETITYSSSCSSSSPRRPRRVLYPASRSRRPPQREDPDPARRWLLLLCALVFLQIYTEETHTCTELQNQNQNQDTAVPHPQQGERGLCSVQGGTGEEPWRIQMVGGASETQLEPFGDNHLLLEEEEQEEKNRRTVIQRQEVVWSELSQEAPPPLRADQSHTGEVDRSELSQEAPPPLRSDQSHTEGR
ncbi:hypothetical protein EYF80_037563 [Liparis tanakae]|uniref:Radiation-inducible immediate-early gene IEX-1 n=1 Tax=Liparis tanakae TaxID=230148 RepID=A0A4Z2GFB4_9TELE|nr:hypothetical protein EYF80_037563 [Liparis tanakae]